MKLNRNKIFYKIGLSILIAVFLISCHSKNNVSKQVFDQKVIDSISVLVKEGFVFTGLNEDKTEILNNTISLIDRIQNDTLRLRVLSNISTEALNSQNEVLFDRLNKKRLQLAKTLKDTVEVGVSFFDYGSFYATNEVFDSAYFNYQQANKCFESIDDDYWSGKTFYSMSSIKNDLMDFTGSEKLAFQAVKKLEGLNKNTSLYLCYNLIGINFQKLNKFEKALFYHNKALRIYSKIKDKGTYSVTSLNNLGLVYHQNGDYQKAIESFREALQFDGLREVNVRLYAKLLDNLAYSRFKFGDTTGLLRDFEKALTIRDSMSNISGIVISKLHLAEYYESNYKLDMAIINAKEAIELAKSVNNYKDELAGLKLLSEFDKKNASKYLKSYIALNDRLQIHERSIRNKFTRIEYETDEYIEETNRLTIQNILISVIGSTIIVILILFYLFHRQKARNEALRLEQDQQKANEEIYSLMMKQQIKLEEGRREERDRISEELHDGVLGRLFGTRVGLGFLDLSGKEEDVKDFSAYVNELHVLENEIRDISHALKNSILKSESSFFSVVEDYITNLSKSHRFHFEIKEDKNILWGDVDAKVKVTLYRIIQEAIQNIIKHAQANNIVIEFCFKNDKLILKVKDDGIGFDNTKMKQGIGLKNMQSRVNKFNGSIDIFTKHKGGTLITVEI
ncbi:tetratricopeptide repeat protein [Aestuariibaculum sp. M13]|uniref:tetratricopeptide repeat-containing sensor histidine kinase n=1 Tax=Aestuariibaculum sp. M13 TaxID=2967132 RepID=UPI002159CA51|nr:tetratricopeptide repeat-containing sensor histidine kinase [Aestuariibaculum sp. M13]MCR8667496.1 tetratricopeptide repeat protein [Aestuariibaculum sp. M13]